MAIPIVLDMACGVSAWGKISTLRMLYGKPIPEGWLLDDDTGQPTSEPSQGRFLAPAAGPRGYGLALIMGILAGAPLSGGLMSCNKTEEPSEHFFMAINIANFTDYDGYVAEISAGHRQDSHIKNSRRRGASLPAPAKLSGITTISGLRAASLST